MTPAELDLHLRAHGLELLVNDYGKLFIAAMPGASLTDEERAAIRAHAPELAAYVRQRQARPDVGADWTRFSLYQLDRILELAVPWSDVNLLIAPGCRIARELRASDPRPGRVWCVCEVLDLLLSGVTSEDARKIGEAKLMLSGTVTVTAVRPDGR